MGPLPGILLGGVLGIAGIVKGHDMMMQVGMLAVILNGFQLLPVLPLDGGRVYACSAVLPASLSRHDIPRSCGGVCWQVSAAFPATRCCSISA